jgi:hypothetical protein
MAGELLRETEVIRFTKSDVDGDGVPIPDTEDGGTWLDVERLIGYTAESGSGADFSREHWNLVWDDENNDRTYTYLKVYLHSENEDGGDDDGTDSGDGSGGNYVVARIPTKMAFENGSGADYQRHTIFFDNSEGNEARETITFRIFGTTKDENGNTEVTRGSYTDAEVINTYTKEVGSGADFQRYLWSPDNSVIPLRDDIEFPFYIVKGTSEELESHREPI